MKLDITHVVTDSELWTVNVCGQSESVSAMDNLSDAVTRAILLWDEELDESGIRRSSYRAIFGGNVMVTIVGKCIPPAIANTGYVVNGITLSFVNSLEEGTIKVLTDGGSYIPVESSMSMGQLISEEVESMIDSITLVVTVGVARVKYDWDKEQLT